MKLPLILVFAIIISLNNFAQSIGNYAVTRTTGITYSSISTSGNAVNFWRNNTGAFQQDDNRSDFINIGFDFWYDGVRYTKVSVSTNGFLDFSSSTDDGGPLSDDFGFTNSAFSSTTLALGTHPALAVFYDDLTAQGASSPLGNSIRYSLTGVAPNRVFMAEWINMAVYTNTTPSLNFQIKLYETTGVIEFIYGTMNTGTFVFSYTLGINGTNVTGPTVAELKNQITANTTTFSNTPQNNLVTLPSANSRIRYTPPVPLNPVGSLTYSAITPTSMTLNWSNWATNEVGYVVYNSTDGVNYTFVTQTAANATSTNLTGLLPGTLYFWKVIAVTEGCLSNPLTGSQGTLPATNKVSNIASGNWNNPGSWLPVGVPTASDNVTILNGHTITINSDAIANDLTVGQGASGILRIGNNATVRTINVNNNIVVRTGAQFITNTASNAVHLINVIGNITNSGTLDFASDANSLCQATFIKNGNQSITGTGAVNNFSTMILNMGTSELNTLNVTSTNFSAPNDFLTLQNGTFRLANTSVTNINLSTAATYTIGSTTGLTLSNTNATINMLGNLSLLGNLRIDNGILNVGNAVNEGVTSNGGELTITGGSFNIAGSYISSTINNLSRFVMSGGALTVPTVGATSSTTLAPFNITSPGSVVIISGGTIIIPREGGTGAQNLGYIISDVISSSVTGGTLQIGSATSPAAQIMRISTVLPIGNLTVLSPNATAQQATALTILKNVLVSSGTFDANNLNTSVGGNWTDNGTFLPGTATVTFNGTSLQQITNPIVAGETFNNLTCASTDTVRYVSPITINGNLIINASSKLDASSLNRTLNLKRNWTNSGTFYARKGLVNLNGTTLQQLINVGTVKFYDLNLTNTAGAKIMSGTYQLEGAYTPTSGNFDVSTATSFTLLSDAVSTARIAQAGTGTITGSMNIQRFISARGAGYSDISSPVGFTTFADWDAELLMIYGYAPPSMYPSAYSYDEVAYDYVPVTSSTDVIAPGVGFEVYLDSYGTYSTFDNTTLDSRGNPTIGNVDLSPNITFANDGWNLIGNPYASFVSWDNLHATSSGVENFIMIYDEVAGDYELINGGTGFEIPPHQGFWVQANSGSPSFVFTESKKTTTTNSTFKSLQNLNFSLRLESKTRKDFFTSKTQFVSQDTDKFGKDVEFKSLPHGLAPDLYSLNESDKHFRLKRVDYSKDDITIPLGFSVGENGVYTISPINIETVTELGFTCVLLTDTKTGVVKQIKADESYTFYAQTTDDEKRFSLQLIKNSVCTEIVSEISLPVSFIDGDHKVTVNTNGTDDMSAVYTIQVYDMLGQKTGSNITLNGNGQVEIDLPFEAGCYLISVTSNGHAAVHKHINR